MKLVVVGVRRNGRSIGEREVVLRAGDSLLLRGTWEALDRQIDDEVLVVDDPGQVRRQVVRSASARRSRSSCWRGWWCSS